MKVCELKGKINVRVKLIIPEDKKTKREPEYLNYDGREGTILAPAGNGGAWVCFEETIDKYVGCPVKWLYPVSKHLPT